MEHIDNVIEKYNRIFEKLYRFPSNFFNLDYIEELSKDILQVSICAAVFEIQELNYMFYIFYKFCSKTKKRELFFESQTLEIITGSSEVIGDVLYDIKNGEDVFSIKNKLRNQMVKYESIVEAKEHNIFILDSRIFQEKDRVHEIINKLNSYVEHIEMNEIEQIIEEFNKLEEIIRCVKIYKFNKNFFKIKNYFEQVTLSNGVMTVKEEYYLIYILKNLNKLSHNISKEVEIETFRKKSIEIELDDLNKIVEMIKNDVGAKNAIEALYLSDMKEVTSGFFEVATNIAKSKNKKISIILENNMKIYKIYKEKLKGTLLHIIRNSCDHGIELSLRRLESGKNENGIITIKAQEIKDWYKIVISDDGAGLDLEKITKKALEKEITTNEEIENMEDEELFNFIFYPGFSTAEIVSDISGRGA